MVVRTYEQECEFVKQVDGSSYRIDKGFSPFSTIADLFLL